MLSDPQASLAVSTNGDHDIKTHTTIKYSLEKCKILIKSRSPHQTAFQVITEVAKTHPKRQQVPQKHSFKQHDFLKILCAARRGDAPRSGREGKRGRGRRRFPSPGSGWTPMPTCQSEDSSSGGSGPPARLLRSACLPLHMASGLAGAPGRLCCRGCLE